ncbi:MAG: hypothetical protein PHH77_02315 [Victivallaceae bacterium]|nr:hypothetical protein [Victivallaceae bacterium]MDD5697426.1 hypothetical protein [Victivallaceae bacterium]
MLEFMKDVVVWLFKKILFFFFPLVGWAVFFYENFPSIAKQILDYLIHAVKFYFQDFYLWLFSEFIAKLTAFFSDHAFVCSVAEFSNNLFTAMNVFLPMNEACACLTFILATVVAVFLLRIVLKAIPTIW